MKSRILNIVVISLVLVSFAFMPKSTTSHKHTYLAIGDAYVIGEGVDEHERWPIQLESSLRNHEYHINYPYFVANKSWTTKELYSRIEEEEFDKHYDLISIQIGVNDEFRKHSLSQFTSDVRTLLTKVVELAGSKHGRVFVLSIPDWSVTPFARAHRSDQLDEIAANIDKYNNILKKEAIALGCHYVDITPISRKAKDDASMTCADQLHPSGEQYKLWTKAMYPTVLKALSMHR